MHKNYKELQKQITLAFIELRKQGFMAKQNWSCCPTCGLSDILAEFKRKYSDRPDMIKGFVFFDCQARDMLKEFGEVYLAWGPTNQELDDDGYIKVARAIVAILKKFNMRVIWNGKIDTTIFVALKNPKKLNKPIDK